MALGRGRKSAMMVTIAGHKESMTSSLFCFSHGVLFLFFVLANQNNARLSDQSITRCHLGLAFVCHNVAFRVLWQVLAIPIVLLLCSKIRFVCETSRRVLSDHESLSVHSPRSSCVRARVVQYTAKRHLARECLLVGFDAYTGKCVLISPHYMRAYESRLSGVAQQAQWLPHTGVFAANDAHQTQHSMVVGVVLSNRRAHDQPIVLYDTAGLPHRQHSGFASHDTNSHQLLTSLTAGVVLYRFLSYNSTLEQDLRFRIPIEKGPCSVKSVQST